MQISNIIKGLLLLRNTMKIIRDIADRIVFNELNDENRFPVNRIIMNTAKTRYLVLNTR